MNGTLTSGRRRASWRLCRKVKIVPLDWKIKSQVNNQFFTNRCSLHFIAIVNNRTCCIVSIDGVRCQSLGLLVGSSLFEGTVMHILECQRRVLVSLQKCYYLKDICSALRYLIASLDSDYYLDNSSSASQFPAWVMQFSSAKQENSRSPTERKWRCFCASATHVPAKSFCTHILPFHVNGSYLETSLKSWRRETSFGVKSPPES